MARIRVAVPLLDDTSLFELGVPCGIFGQDRLDLDSRWYELTLCEPGPRPARAPGGVSLRTGHGLEAVADADLVVVPACVMATYRPPGDLLDALRAAHARGARIASLCSGAFVLADAGLLDGRTVTTHWRYAEELRRAHPRVRVDERALYSDDGAILTSAGSAAAIDLCLHIVRGDFGTAVAAEVGRELVVAPHREGDQAQYVPVRLPRPADTGLAPVLDWALERVDRPLTIGDLAARAGLSVRTFERHFGAETGTTPLRWLNRQRVGRARELLETTDLPVDVVALRSGLGTAAGLRKHFAREVGTTPSAYRRTFRVTAPSAPA